MGMWPPWPPVSTAANKKFLVKAKEMKVEGFFDNDDQDGADRKEKVMAVEIGWKGGPKPGLATFYRQSSKRRKHMSREVIVKRGEPITWDDQFENIFSFPATSWDVSFTLLYKSKTETKLAEVGKVSLNLAEMASKMESLIEAKIPINFNVAGVAGEATLSMCFSFVEIRDSQDLAEIGRNSTESKYVEGTGDGDGSGDDNDRDGKEKEKQTSMEKVSGDDSDESAVFHSEGTPESELVAMAGSSSSSDSETRLDSEKKGGFFSWKRRRRSSYKPGKTKVEPLIKKTREDDDSKIDVDRQQKAGVAGDATLSKLEATGPSGGPEEQEESSTSGHWVEKELISRDGQSKLKASVFFASFDQCSGRAAGESACTALVAVITHWLQSNQDDMPTRSEFNRLIVEGSSEWRKLCDNGDLISRFPDKHFDLETVLQAGLRPISVLPEKSFIGFFDPEKFESLKGAMSFDQIWEEIISNADGDGPWIYIVSWNDHFFVLKVDAEAFYIIDTLGERLFEGCNQAYILRFDNTAVISAKVEREKVSSTEEIAGADPTEPENTSEEEIYRGKECCREFITRFLAAIQLRELGSEEKKEPVSYFDLHHRLQIEFNFTSLLSSTLSSTSSAANSTSSLF
ncbi:hypothetical protein U1Q18_018645 [Sarracenia purpurea var. burkii]